MGSADDDHDIKFVTTLPIHLLASLLRIRDEQGYEIFYNFAVTPWLVLGADLQIINPSLASDRAVFPGLRTVIKF
jgi:hypothetical protein